MATNRPDQLDPALLRPGRMDRKIEIPLPNEAARLDILKIHAKVVSKQGEFDFEAIAKFCEDFNRADMRVVCTEAGMFAIRAYRDYVIQEDFMKAARKIKETKKLESKLNYAPVWYFNKVIYNWYSQISSFLLFRFNSFEKCFKIAGAETLMVASLDDFQEKSWSVLNGFGEDLK